MPSDEDDRDVDVFRGEVSLEFKAAPSGKPDVKHEARGPFRAAGGEEFAHVAEQLRLQPDGSRQAAERLADCLIIVDDDDTVDGGCWAILVLNPSKRICGSCLLWHSGSGRSGAIRIWRPLRSR